VGSNDLETVDVRVICASKADLMTLCQEGRFAEAIPAFQFILSREPKHLGAVLGLGWCLKRTGRVGDAVRVYEEALKRLGEAPETPDQLLAKLREARFTPGAPDAVPGRLHRSRGARRPAGTGRDGSGRGEGQHDPLYCARAGRDVGAGDVQHGEGTDALKEETVKPKIEVTNVKIRAIHDSDPDLSYLEDESRYAGLHPAEAAKYRQQDRVRLASYGDSWWMIGIYAQADVTVFTPAGGVIQQIRSGGLYGIERDSTPDYLLSVAKEEYNALKVILQAMGAKKIPTINQVNFRELEQART
jgi:tetratricopeptide (TPR) repeat protein